MAPLIMKELITYTHLHHTKLIAITMQGASRWGCTPNSQCKPSTKRILTDLTRPSSERWTPMTIAIFQANLGVWSSTDRTTSPTLTLFLLVFHLKHAIKNWTISCFRLVQKRTINNWTLYHWRRAYKSTFTGYGFIWGLSINFNFMGNK